MYYRIGAPEDPAEQPVLEPKPGTRSKSSMRLGERVAPVIEKHKVGQLRQETVETAQSFKATRDEEGKITSFTQRHKPEKEPFPWLYVGIGLAGIAIVLATK